MGWDLKLLGMCINELERADKYQTLTNYTSDQVLNETSNREYFRSLINHMLKGDEIAKFLESRRAENGLTQNISGATSSFLRVLSCWSRLFFRYIFKEMFQYKETSNGHILRTKLKIGLDVG